MKRDKFFSFKENKYEIINDREVSLIEGDKVAAEVDIPVEVEHMNKKYKVVTIRKRAFYKCHSLKSVIIPNSVTSIRKHAFSECRNLESVIIPEGVISIGKYAFFNCTNLTNITIPNSVTFIGKRIFIGCNNLMNINVDSLNPNYCSIDCVLFNKEQTRLIQYPAGNKRTEYKVPARVTSIDKCAFNRCNNLERIDIQNSINFDDPKMFSSCKMLKIMCIECYVVCMKKNHRWQILPSP